MSLICNPDIDQERSHLNYHLVEPRLKYFGEIQTRIEQAQKENPKCKVRKDSVKFIDTIITASPEYFAALPPEKVHRYFERALEFLQQEVGAENIFSAVVHMDESNPHMHYTLAGLSQINRESIDAIRTAVWELEKAGYIKRQQGRDEKGKMTAIEYTIYEQPQPPDDNPPGLDKPILENPTPGNPILENPTPGKPMTENPMQLNKDIQKTDLPKKEKIITDEQSTHSIPILSPNPSPSDGETATPPERKQKETEPQTAFEIYREIIKDNIDYDILMQDMKPLMER